MRIFLSFTLSMLVWISTEAQYISSITIPDSSDISKRDTVSTSFKFASTITSADLKTHLTELSSDAYKGREAGTEYIDKAADYIADYFNSLGVAAIGAEGSYFQDVAFTWSRWESGGVKLTVGDTTYKHLQDFLAFPNQNENLELESDEVVFLGFGIDDKKYSDYKKNDVSGKVILIYDGEPVNKKGISQITKSTNLSPWSDGFEMKLVAAKKHGVKEVLIIPNDFKAFMAENRRRVLRFVMELGNKTGENSPYANACYISSNVARKIMGDKYKKVIKSRDRSKKRGKACDVAIPNDVKISKQREQRTLIGKNIMAYFEGTDKKDEVIVVSAHYDHVGFRGDDIFNGANDNASGTVTVMEIAEALSKAAASGVKPRRSILLLLVTAEEKGLLGSQYYSEYPVFPIDKTVCNINIDMVGRSDKKYINNPDYIYVIGSDRLSTDLHKVNEAMNKRYTQITLDYTYNDENDPNRYYYRSDHYNFARKGIPAIFFFNGVHRDYHRSTDTVEKINFDQMRKVAQLIFHTCWEVANREDRLVVDGEIK